VLHPVDYQRIAPPMFLALFFLTAGGQCRYSGGSFLGELSFKKCGKTQVFERPAEGKTTCLNNGEFTGEYRTILSEKCYPEMNLASFSDQVPPYR
jgi:hypothetical protein